MASACGGFDHLFVVDIISEELQRLIYLKTPLATDVGDHLQPQPVGQPRQPWV